MKRSMEQMGCLLIFVVLIAAGIFGWYLFNEYAVANCELYVDNGSDSTYQVSINGQEVLTVEPGTVGKAVTYSGGRRIKVTSGSTVIYDEMKTLKRGNGGKTGRYLLNPDGKHRYWTFVAEYGPSNGFDLSQFQNKLGPDPIITADEAYRKVAGLVKLVPESKWMRGNFDLVLETPPERLPAEREYDRKTLNCVLRLDNDKYQYLRAANTQKSVTSEELDEMKTLVKKLYESTRP